MANNKNFIAKNGLALGDGYDMPDVRPSLLLDFANSKALDPRVTFSRGSTGTYWDGEATTKAEENLVKYSQTLSNAFWADNLCTQGSSTTAPDGTTTATPYTVNAGTGTTPYVAFSATIDWMVTNAVYTASIYAKAGTHNYIQGCANAMSTMYVNFDLSTGSVGTTGGGATGTIIDIGDGWYRCTFTYTAAASGSSPFIAVVNSSSAGRRGQWSPAGTETFTLWGFQLEERDSATAYIATTTNVLANYQPVLQTALNNKPRFDHDPSTGESKGLLVEEARTNQETYSNLDATTWTIGAGAYTPINDVVGLDGSIQGKTYRKKRTNANGYYRPPPFTAPANQTDPRIFSIYVKKANWRYVGIRCAGGTMGSGTSGGTHAIFDLDTQTWGANTPSDYSYPTGGKGYEYVGNGWYRIWVWRKNWNVTYEQGQLAYYGVCACASMTNGSETWDSSGTDVVPTIYFWGAQFEHASFATSYIPTSGATVTRSADAPEVPISAGSSWYANEGTLYGKFSMGGFVTSQSPISLYSTSIHGNNWMGFYSSTPQSNGTSAMSVTAYRAAPADSNSAGGSIRTTSGGATTRYYAVGEVIQAAMSFSQTEYNSGGSGAILNQTGSYLVPSHTVLSLYKLYSGGFAAQAAHIRKVAFYPQPMTQAQLEALTED